MRFRAGEADAGVRLDAALAAHGVAPVARRGGALIDSGAVRWTGAAARARIA